MGKLAVKHWLKKVESAIEDLGEEVAIVRIDTVDGESVQSDATIKEVQDGVPGTYRLIDSDGKRLAECTIGAGGVRSARPESHSATASAAATRMQAAAVDSWDRLTTHLTASLEAKDKRIDELRAEIDDYKEQLLEAKANLVEAQQSGGDQSELYALIRDCVPLLLGNKTKEELARIAMRIGPQLTPEARAEILPLLNAELSAQKNSMLEAFVSKASEDNG